MKLLINILKMIFEFIKSYFEMKNLINRNDSEIQNSVNRDIEDARNSIENKDDDRLNDLLR